MNTIRRFMNFFIDSPTFGRDRARLISGFTIGTSTLLLNGAILLMMVPLLNSPDAPGFQRMTDHVGFSQILALILLGGATAFATLLIPLRLATVFFETRIGRYFDQIVLSGISPLHFLIGKVTSQNLFIGLFMFLLIPYLVFCVTLGGVNFTFFLAGLFLIWLYCMTLALVMLCLSLYINEFLAAIFVIFVASILSFWGCYPFKFQPCIFTPFPVLVHPVHTSIPQLKAMVEPNLMPKFLACTLGMSLLSALALTAIHMGPLYGIIRENSTFGEVVRAGDSKRKRWFRFRPHIQRSSEIAFFYVNRGDWFTRHEGLIRWGGGLCFLLVASMVANVAAFLGMRENVLTWNAGQTPWFASGFHGLTQTIHGLGLILAIILFSHAKNTTYLRLPFLFGWKVEVSKLDTAAFLLFTIFSSVVCLVAPILFEQHVAIPNSLTIFPIGLSPIDGWPAIDYSLVSREGTFTLSFLGLVIYALHRALCLATWMKSLSAAVVGALYSVLIWMMPVLAGSFILQGMPELRQIEILTKLAPVITAISPMSAMSILFMGRMGQPFPDDMSRIPFYVFHGCLLLLTLIRIRFSGRSVRREYLSRNM